jgi:hypothetical protein
LEEQGILHLKEKWENENILMLPAQFFIEQFD